MHYYKSLEPIKSILRRSAFLQPLLALLLRLDELIFLRKALARGYFSENKEDSFIVEYFRHVKTGKYIDVGANHPFKNSNTYLLYNQGWSGINIEPIPQRFKRIAQARPRDINLNVGVGQVNGTMTFYELSASVLSTFNKQACDEVIRMKKAHLVKAYDIPIMTLTEICENYLPGESIDLLSIDTEGYEMEVLQGIDWEKIKPKLIVLETTTRSQEYGETDLLDFLSRKRYKVINKIGLNSLFVPES